MSDIIFDITAFWIREPRNKYEYKRVLNEYRITMPRDSYRTFLDYVESLPRGANKLSVRTACEIYTITDITHVSTFENLADSTVAKLTAVGSCRVLRRLDRIPMWPVSVRPSRV